MAPPVEISIPTTSQVTGGSGSGSDTKPYTLYNITLRLPLRSFVVQKRYSEFAALHAALVGVVGEAPPAPLPGKSWFRSTVASAELTETRRVGLEAYMRAIAESPDRRWRDTSAWRAFLNLPSAGSGGGGGGSASSKMGSDGGGGGGGGNALEQRLPAIGLAAANAAAASDPGTWIDLHKEMKKALHDARLQLARRDAAAAGGMTSSSWRSGAADTPSTTGVGAAASAGVAAKRELVRVGSLLSALTAGLKAMEEAKRLGAGELRRRRDLLAAARVERDGLETLSARMGSADGGAGGSAAEDGRAASAAAPGSDRAALFGGASQSGGGGGGSSSGRRVLGAPLPETERTRELDNHGVLQVQRQMLSEQDQEVAMLAQIVQRQRAMGLAIKDEVDRQTPMLEQMSDDVDRVQGKVRVAKDRIRRLG